MCEPAHSIVQYSDNFDDTGLPFGGQMDKESRLQAAFSKAGTWAKKVGRWFHISKMGAGHDGATGFDSPVYRYLPEPVNYEGFWWERKFAEDGFSCNVEATSKAFAAAYEYHKRVCMGNVKVFRQFLEMSLNKTNRFNSYLDAFVQNVLVQKGRDSLLKKLQLILPGRQPSFSRFPQMYPNIHPAGKQKAIKAMMGYTRKRHLFVPEWADDGQFWS